MSSYNRKHWTSAFCAISASSVLIFVCFSRFFSFAVEVLTDERAAALPREKVGEPVRLLFIVLEQAFEQHVRGQRVLEGAVLLLRVPAKRLQEGDEVVLLALRQELLCEAPGVEIARAEADVRAVLVVHAHEREVDAQDVVVADGVADDEVLRVDEVEELRQDNVERRLVPEVLLREARHVAHRAVDEGPRADEPAEDLDLVRGDWHADGPDLDDVVGERPGHLEVERDDAPRMELREPLEADGLRVDGPLELFLAPSLAALVFLFLTPHDTLLFYSPARARRRTAASAISVHNGRYLSSSPCLPIARKDGPAYNEPTACADNKKSQRCTLTKASAIKTLRVNSVKGGKK